MQTTHLVYNYCTTCDVVYRRQHASKHEIEGRKKTGKRCSIHPDALYACLIHQSHRWICDKEWITVHSKCSSKMKSYNVNLNTKRNLKGSLRSLFGKRFPQLGIIEELEDSFSSCRSDAHLPAFKPAKNNPSGRKESAPILRQALLSTAEKSKSKIL